MSNISELVCPRCCKQFGNKYNLGRHSRRKVLCSIIDKTTTAIEKPNKSFSCDKCGQTFTRLYSLQRHQNLICNQNISHGLNHATNLAEDTLISSENNVSYDEFMSLREEVERLKNISPIININNINQNILHIKYVKSDDNYSDI